MAERIRGTDFEEKVSKAQGVVLVDFYSDSCVPCRQLAPVLSEIEEEYSGKAAVCKVNVNYEGELAAAYQVMSAPTLVLFRDGEVLGRKSGVQKKSVLAEWLDEALTAN